MPPATGPALLILVAFVLPGFVTILIQERTFSSAEDPTPLDRLLRIIYYSVWTYLLLAVAALVCGVDRSYLQHLYEHYKDNPAQLVWRGALVILVPSIIIATATRIWLGSRLQRWALQLARINERHEEPTAWDYFFRQRIESYVQVKLADGGRVLGYYGARSFASYAKDGRDLFLERIYFLDPKTDWFGQEIPGSSGVWIRTDDVVSIDFYTPQHALQQAATQALPAEAASEEEGGPRAAEVLRQDPASSAAEER